MTCQVFSNKLNDHLENNNCHNKQISYTSENQLQNISLIIVGKTFAKQKKKN